MPLLTEIAVIIICYAIGCFSPGYWLVRWRTGDDVRDHKSGSTGARNVGRRLGRKWAVTTFALDAAKGMAAVALARWLGMTGWALAATLPVVVSGHVWPVQMQLRGGRGLSTAFGAALVLAPLIPLGVVALAALLTALTRRISASVLVAIVPAPLIGAIGGAPPATIASVATTIVIVLFAHRTMIRAMIVRRSSASATGLVGRGDDAGSAGPAASGAPVPPKGPAR